MAKSNVSLSVNQTNCKSSAEEHYKISPGETEILQIKKKIINVVENLSEENISVETLIKSCRLLSKADYTDVIEERSIQRLCGYPVCSNSVTPQKQKFHIVCKVNRVYDITERKCFCSNKCYKASCYLKEQLSEAPLWLQETPVKVKLLADKENRGSSGDCVDMILNTSDVKADENIENDENMDWFTNKDKKLISDEIMDSMTDHVANLAIKERNFPSNANMHNGRVLQSPSSFSNLESSLKSLMEIDRNDSDPDDDGLVNEEKHLSEKFMPVPSKNKIKQLILVEPHSNLPIKQPPSSATISLHFVQNCLKEWVTDSTLAFLSNETSHCSSQELNPSNAKLDSTNMSESHVVPSNKENNMAEDNDEKNNSLSIDQLCTNPDLERIKLFLQGEDLCPDKKEQKKKVKFKTGKNIKIMENKGSETGKKKNSAPHGKPDNEIVEKADDPTAIEKLVLPKVDSLSQSALRQQVVCTQLKKAYSVILPFIGVHYNVLGNLVPELVASFRLTAVNVVFKPREWKLIAIVLLRMLVRSNGVKAIISEELAKDTVFCALLMKTGFSKDFSLPEIDQMLQNFVQL